MTLQTLTRKLKAFQEPIQSRILKWLYLNLPPQPIRSRKGHRTYASVVGILLQECAKGMDRLTLNAVSKYLSAVTPFIEEFEKKEFVVRAASPEEVLAYLMEQNEITQYDLAKDLGGQPVVSDVLNGKRKLTREHIERLSRRFHVSPATFYPVA